MAILGVLGACRCHELADLLFRNVEEVGNQMYVVKIPVTKTGVMRSFTVSDGYYRLVKKYVNLRPVDADIARFFLNYKNGRCMRQVIGKNSISKYAGIVAQYLKLPDVSLYTGHSFRRTSATFLANAGGDLIAIKRQGENKLLEGKKFN